MSDSVEVYKRIHGKLLEIFANTGGCMQIIYSIFSILSFIYNNYNFGATIMDNLFTYNLLNKKLVLKHSFEKSTKYEDYKNNISMNIPKFKNSDDQSQIKSRYDSRNYNYIKDILPSYKPNLLSDSRIQDINLMKKNLIKRNDFSQANLSLHDKDQHSSNKIINDNSAINLNKYASHFLLINKQGKKSEDIEENMVKEKNSKKDIFTKILIKREQSIINSFHYNFFQYFFYSYCNCFRNNKTFDLYQYGIEMIKDQLDIINEFNVNFLFNIYFKKIINIKSMKNNDG